MEACGKIHGLVPPPPEKGTLLPIGQEDRWVPGSAWTRWLRKESLSQPGPHLIMYVLFR
jgi:hypothetical protein